MFLATSLFLITFSVSAAGQATHTVIVGVEASLYDPPTTDALEGDTITFIFGGVIHGVTQSSFAAPCSPIPGGFSSGLTGIEGNASAQAPVWNLQIANASEPIWFFCEATQPESHCQNGMVGAINPPSADMFVAFQSAAKAVASTPTPTPTVILSGIGAFATAAPAPTAAPETTPSSSSPSPSSTVPSFASQSSPKSTPIGAIIGGAVGGGVAVAILVILGFILLHRRRGDKSRVTGGVDATGNSSYLGSNTKMPLSADSTPSTSAFDRGLSYGDAEARVRQQAGPNDFASALERNSFSSPSDRTTSEPGLTYSDGERNREIQLRYANSRPEMRTVTMLDAHTPTALSRPYPDALTSERSHLERQILERGPEVNVHELAKEVAALISLHGRSALRDPGNNQPVSGSLPGPDIPVAPDRAVRQLPNPQEFVSRGTASVGHESTLPQYER
ncbi:hypothetical protein M0805_006273 [Coniferiporia weirii]|nr:hypothetical protein M0805_006273 [Coniferiporia weirii]